MLFNQGDLFSKNADNNEGPAKKKKRLKRLNKVTNFIIIIKSLWSIEF